MIAALFLAGSAAAYTNTTTTLHSTAYVTIPCSSTTLTYGTETYTVSEATTLTLQDCSCTHNASLQKSSTAASSTTAAPSVAPASSTAPVLANGAAAGKVGAAAGVAAAVAYLL